MSKILLQIDGREVEAEEGMTILDAARSVGINIPTLCYHEELEPYGACRICVVEIDAGDTYLYDEEAAQDKAEREQQAADRIFGLLPRDQAGEFRRLWEEFEARHTPEAKFAAALDRFQPLLHNYHTEGVSWKHHGVTSDKVMARVAHMQEGAPLLWEYAQNLIQRSVAKGYLAP